MVFCPSKAINNRVMHPKIRSMAWVWNLQVLTLLTLGWRSFSECRRDHVPVALACTGCLHRLPISLKWMSATNWKITYSRCQSKNRWNSVDAHGKIGRWRCCNLFCQYKWHIRTLCITPTKSLLIYGSYKSTNCCRSIDALANNGAVTVLLSPLPINAVNMTVMHNKDQVTVELRYIHDLTSLTLRWPSCSEWGNDCLAISIPNKSSQYVRYTQPWPSHWWIAVLRRP